MKIDVTPLITLQISWLTKQVKLGIGHFRKCQFLYEHTFIFIQKLNNSSLISSYQLLILKPESIINYSMNTIWALGLTRRTLSFTLLPFAIPCKRALVAEERHHRTNSPGECIHTCISKQVSNKWTGYGHCRCVFVVLMWCLFHGRYWWNRTYMWQHCVWAAQSSYYFLISTFHCYDE